MHVQIFGQLVWKTQKKPQHMLKQTKVCNTESQSESHGIYKKVEGGPLNFSHGLAESVAQAN